MLRASLLPHGAGLALVFAGGLRQLGGFQSLLWERPLPPVSHRVPQPAPGLGWTWGPASIPLCRVLKGICSVVAEKKHLALRWGCASSSLG